MSYYLSLSIFKDIVEEKDVLSRALSFCNNVNLYKEIENNLVYCPNYSILLHTKDISIKDLTLADKLFLENIFSYKFIYWKKYKLLAVVHDINNSEVQRVVFQNSTDRDYKYDYWQFLYNHSDSCRSDFKYINDKAIHLDPTIDDYDGRTNAYDYIEQKLHIINYMYEINYDDMVVFKLSRNISDQEKLELCKLLVKAFKNRNEIYQKAKIF